MSTIYTVIVMFKYVFMCSCTLNLRLSYIGNNIMYMCIIIMHACRYNNVACTHACIIIILLCLAKGWKADGLPWAPQTWVCFVLFWCGFNNHKNGLISLIWPFNHHSLYKNYELAKTPLTCIYHSSEHADRVGYITNVISLSFCN